MKRILMALSAALVFGIFVPPHGVSQEYHPRDVSELTEEELQFSEELARVCANEAFRSRADCMLIFQTARRRGETIAERRTWLHNHCDCVFADHDPDPSSPLIGNCLWSRHLTRSLERPALWPSHLLWEDRTSVNDDGTEHVEHGGQYRWAQTLSWTDHMVAGHRPREGWPCPRDPDTWGGRTTDHERISRALSEGRMEQLYCIDHANHRSTLNEGFRFLSHH
jgi:hypothetical protein